MDTRANEKGRNWQERDRNIEVWTGSARGNRVLCVGWEGLRNQMTITQRFIRVTECK